MSMFCLQCSNHDAQSSANVTSEESGLANLLPMLPNLVGDLIPPPMDDLVPWDEQRNSSRDKRREQGADKKNATLLPMFWEFLDEYVYLAFLCFFVLCCSMGFTSSLPQLVWD